MSVLDAPLARRRIRRPGSLSPTSWPVAALGWAGVLLFAVVLGVGLSRFHLSPVIALGGSVALVAAFALVLTRYDTAIALGFLLMAVVLVEPAPSDMVFGLVMIVAAVTGRFRLRRVPRTAIWAVSAFLCLNLLSLTDVISWSAAGRFFLITLYLGMFSLWLAGYVDRPDRSAILVRAYLVIGVLSALAGSLALFVHFPGSTILVGDTSRAKALFKDPNVFGPFLVPIAVILAEEILRPRLLRLRRSAKLLCFLIITLGILFSYSRAAWLNYIVALVVLVGIVVLRRPDRRALALVTVLVVGALSIVGAVIGTGSLTFLKERAQLQSYDTTRFAAQSDGLSVGIDHPFGVGPGQFDVISPVSTHSLYVRSLSEQGVLGLGVIIIVIASTFSYGAVNVLRGRDTHGISAAALLAAWSGLVANSFFVDTLHWRHLWLVAGLIWAGAAVEVGRPAGSKPGWAQISRFQTADRGRLQTPDRG